MSKRKKFLRGSNLLTNQLEYFHDIKNYPIIQKFFNKIIFVSQLTFPAI